MTNRNTLDEKTVSDVRYTGLDGLSGEPRPGLYFLSGPQAGSIAHLDRGRWVIGRSLEADITYAHESVSRQHCEVVVSRNGTVHVRDLGSLNGTQVDGRSLERGESLALKEGDTVRLSAFAHMKFVRQSPLEAELQAGLYEAAVQDPLTGLLNRRALDERLAQDFSFALRHGPSLVLAVIDLDHFKRVNDTYGHDAGDAVLRQVSARIREQVRQEDLVARFGGEEFVVVMRGAQPSEAVALAERIRHAVAARPVGISGGSLQITLSIGVAHIGERSVESASDLFVLADRRLYAAKQGGRNQVVGP